MEHARSLRRWSLLCLVTLVGLGVLAMHVFGVGHHQAMGHESSSRHGPVMTDVTVAAIEQHAPEGPVAAVGDDPAAAGAVCLAVLPLLLLLRSGPGRAVDVVVARASMNRRSLVTRVRPEPPWLTPPLSRLCVLRT